MNKYKYYIIVVGCFFLFGIGTALNIWFTPHVDVQSSPTFEKIAVKTFIDQAIEDINTFNQKYLSADGESKIIEIEGLVSNISKNMNNETVILLKDASFKDAGVMCTLIDTNIQALPVENSLITIKGIIRSGAEYDEDLELYIDAVLEKGKIVN